MSNASIAVVGSANVDFILSLGQLPAPGETVTDGRFARAFGGKGANTAVAAARAGGRVTLVGAVGDDGISDEFLQSLGADGIDTANVRRDSTRPCGTALIMVDGRGENLIGVAPGANDAVTPAAVRACENVIANAAYVLLQMEIPPEANREALTIAARHGTPVLFNYAPVRGVPIDVCQAMTTLVVNEGEAFALSGIEVSDRTTAAAAAVELRKAGPSLVIVTLGAEGVVSVSAAGVEAFSAFPVAAVDSTAAGDTFCGALGAALAEGLPAAEGIRFASAAAAISVTRAGAQPSIPSRAEIEAFLCEHAPH